MMINDEDYPDIIQQLIEMGALEVVGYDAKSDQITYGLTPKCQELFPELFDEHFKMINEIAFKLWNQGIIEMQFDSDGVPMVMIKDLEYTINIKDNLPDEDRFFLENLIQKHQDDMKRK